MCGKLRTLECIYAISSAWDQKDHLPSMNTVGVIGCDQECFFLPLIWLWCNFCDKFLVCLNQCLRFLIHLQIVITFMIFYQCDFLFYSSISYAYYFYNCFFEAIILPCLLTCWVRMQLTSPRWRYINPRTPRGGCINSPWDFSAMHPELWGGSCWNFAQLMGHPLRNFW